MQNIYVGRQSSHNRLLNKRKTQTTKTTENTNYAGYDRLPRSVVQIHREHIDSPGSKGLAVDIFLRKSVFPTVRALTQEADDN